jgi:hypothetical protein
LGIFFDNYALFKYFSQKQTGGFALMKAYREELFNIPRRRDFVNITPRVENYLQKRLVQGDMIYSSSLILSA